MHCSNTLGNFHGCDDDDDDDTKNIKNQKCSMNKKKKKEKKKDCNDIHPFIHSLIQQQKKCFINTMHCIGATQITIYSFINHNYLREKH